MKSFVPMTASLVLVLLSQTAVADNSATDRKFSRGHGAVAKSISDAAPQQAVLLPANVQRLFDELSAPVSDSRPTRVTFESKAGARAVLQVDLESGAKKVRVFEYGTGRVRGDWAVTGSDTPEQRQAVAVDVIDTLGLFPDDLRHATRTAPLPKSLN